MHDRRESLAIVPARASVRAWLGLLIVGLGGATAALDSAVNIAFPSITRAFALEVAGIQWVVIAYMLSHGSLLLMFGKLGDIVGYLRIFRFGLTCSAAAFLACSLAPSYGWLLAGRILQGVGAALTVSCGVALATSLFDERHRTRIIGLHGALLAVGSALGPLVGGMLVEIWGWQAVFAGRLPLALTALALSIILPPPRTMGTARLDVLGSALLAVWISSLLLGFASLRFGPADLLTLLLALATLTAFAGFVWRQQRAAEPIIRLAIFRDVPFSALHAASILTNAAGFAVMLLVPFALSRIAGLNARDGGSMLALSLIGVIAGSFLSPRLCEMLGRRTTAVAGMLACSAGLAVIGGPAVGPGGMAATTMAAGLLLNGLGLGLFQVAYTDLTVGALPTGERGVAGSLATLTRTIGVVSGAAGLSGLFDMAQSAALRSGVAVEIAFREAFEATLSLASLAVLVAVPMLAASFRMAPRTQPRASG